MFKRAMDKDEELDFVRQEPEFSENMNIMVRQSRLSGVARATVGC